MLARATSTARIVRSVMRSIETNKALGPLASRRRAGAPCAERRAERGDVHDDTLASHLVSVTEVRMSPVCATHRCS